MGSIAENYCENVYLTDDNPRKENPRIIRNQIKKGFKHRKFFEISSRSKAISFAINKLNSGDVLIVAGKGHENYQEYKKKIFFSDKLEILKAITKKNKNLSNSLKTNILKETLGNESISKKISIKLASINSKNIKKNTIFVGVKGKKIDGNIFANSELDKFKDNYAVIV